MRRVAEFDEDWYAAQLIGPDNPFDDAYVKREVKWYGAKALQVATADGLTLQLKNPQGALPDYFNKNFRLDPTLLIPTLYLDGVLWMSLTPMEIQSQFLAINNASGEVGVAGLGMGYAALKMAQKPEVVSVTVFEIDNRVIDFFNRTFRRRKGFKKIEIVPCDARSVMPTFQFDFLYVDIYATMLPDEIVEDIERFSACVRDFPEGYCFWGQERVLLDAALGHALIDPEDLPLTLRALLGRWMKTPVSLTDPRLADTMLSDMYHPVPDVEFIEKVLDALGMEH